MPKLSPRMLLAALSLGLPRANAAELRLPPINGEFEGVVTRFALPGAPELKWKGTAKASGDGSRAYTLTTTGNGVHLRVSAHTGANGDGNWQIEDSQLDVGIWLAAVLPTVAPSVSGIVAEGKLVTTGGGELRKGQPLGRIKVELKDGVVRNAAQGWTLEGVSLRGEFSFTSDGLHWSSEGPIDLGVRTITSSRFGARNFVATATVDDRLVVGLKSATIELAGGSVSVTPCEIPLSPVAVNLQINILRVGLQDLVALVPAGLADARGRIDGTIRLSWSDEDGLMIGAGQLGLRDDEPTTVRLEAAPGFLTKRVPERIALVPASLGALSRWLSPVNPAYADLSAIEMGQTDLRVQSLTVKMTPDGDELGRSASVHVVAKPVNGKSTVGLLTFDINVAGPLSAVLKLGMQEGVSFGVR